jgi:hypothetical protein
MLSDIAMEISGAGVAKETITAALSGASVKTTYGPDLVQQKRELQAALLANPALDCTRTP